MKNEKIEHLDSLFYELASVRYNLESVLERCSFDLENTKLGYDIQQAIKALRIIQNDASNYELNNIGVNLLLKQEITDSTDRYDITFILRDICNETLAFKELESCNLTKSEKAKLYDFATYVNDFLDDWTATPDN